MLGVVQRQTSEEEIFQRLMLALANEGRKILRDGIAQLILMGWGIYFFSNSITILTIDLT